MKHLDLLKNTSSNNAENTNDKTSVTQEKIKDIENKIQQLEEDFEILAQHIYSIGQIVGYIKNTRDKE